MSIITPVVDIDKQNLINQYNAAIIRLDEIINQPLNTNAIVIQAIRDEAVILKRIAIILKKLIQHEIR